MERTYLVFFYAEDGWGFFKFKSTHRAGSEANRKDAEAESLRLYGTVLDLGDPVLYKKKQYSRKPYF